jgi:hypothetical protein
VETVCVMNRERWISVANSYKILFGEEKSSYSFYFLSKEEQPFLYSCLVNFQEEISNSLEQRY